MKGSNRITKPATVGVVCVQLLGVHIYDINYMIETETDPQ